MLLARLILQMIEEGRLQPWKVASHMLPLSEAPEGYAKFDAKEFNKVHRTCPVGLCSWLHLSFVARVVPIASVQQPHCATWWTLWLNAGHLIKDQRCVASCPQVILKPPAVLAANA